MLHSELGSIHHQGFPGGSVGIESACQCRRLRRHGFNLWVGRSPGERHGSPLQYPVFLSRESHGQRSLASYNPWGCKESNMTEPSSPRKTKQSIGSESFSATLDKVILPLKG